MNHKFLIFIVLPILFYACQNNSSQVQQQSETKQGILHLQEAFPDSIARLRPIMEGVWISSKYLDAIKKTKSPFKAAESIETTNGFNINFDNYKDNSVNIHFNFGNHEGDFRALKFQKVIGINIFPIDIVDSNTKGCHGAITYEITKKDTFLYLIELDSNNKIKKRQKFTRVLKTKTDDLSIATEYIINSNIFAGEYKDISTDKKYLFDSQGVTTFLNNEKYRVLEDFMGSYGFNIIDFNTSDNLESSSFGFEFRKDTLLFYDFKMKWDTLNNINEPIDYNEIKYRLLKIK